MVPPDQDGSREQAGRRGDLSVVHDQPATPPTAPDKGPAATPDELLGSLASSNALSPHSNLILGFCLPTDTDHPSEPGLTASPKPPAPTVITGPQTRLRDADPSGRAGSAVC